MNKYRCKKCTFVYDPSENDNVAFDDLPADYTCPVCGVGKDEFEVIHQKGEEYTGGEAQEKHVPVLEAADGGVLVKVGSIPHPMEEAHYITSIELYDGKKLLKKSYMEAGSSPEFLFEGFELKESMHALAYCNIHGVWES